MDPYRATEERENPMADPYAQPSSPTSTSPRSMSIDQGPPSRSRPSEILTTSSANDPKGYDIPFSTFFSPETIEKFRVLDRLNLSHFDYHVALLFRNNYTPELFDKIVELLRRDVLGEDTDEIPLVSFYDLHFITFDIQRKATPDAIGWPELHDLFRKIPKNLRNSFFKLNDEDAQSGNTFVEPTVEAPRHVVTALPMPPPIPVDVLETAKETGYIIDKRGDTNGVKVSLAREARNVLVVQETSVTEVLLENAFSRQRLIDYDMENHNQTTNVKEPEHSVSLTDQNLPNDSTDTTGASTATVQISMLSNGLNAIESDSIQYAIQNDVDAACSSNESQDFNNHTRAETELDETEPGNVGDTASNPAAENKPTYTTGNFMEQWLRIYRAHPSGTLEDLQTDFCRMVISLERAGMFRSNDYFVLLLETSMISIVRTPCIPHNMVHWDESFRALARFVTAFVFFMTECVPAYDRVFLFKQIVAFVTRNVTEEMTQCRWTDVTTAYELFIAALLNEVLSSVVYAPHVDAVLLIFLGDFVNALRPTSVPNFTFTFSYILSLETITSRLMTSTKAVWELYGNLVVELFVFTGPRLDPVRSGAIETLYERLRTLAMNLYLVCPTLLSTYAIRFLEFVPLNQTQLRNIVLAAIPTQIVAFDPLNVTKYKNIQRICKRCTPGVTLDFNSQLGSILQDAVDQYLFNKTPRNFPGKLAKSLEMPKATHQLDYNMSLMNSFVLYVLVHGIDTIQRNRKEITRDVVGQSSHCDLMLRLAYCFDTHGTYVFINTMVNHLRFPSKHTHFIMMLLLNLFKQTESRLLKEMIVRTLYERLLVHRPWPWGLVVCFLELSYRNPKVYRFWSQDTFDMASFLAKVKRDTPSGHCFDDFTEPFPDPIPPRAP